ncbi:MAG: hypothetical protein HOO88_05940 [Kiritimatiellaceae bacterium]|nr:hypothetical protein [Kiritimatiellaceae bacterium]
MTPASCHEFYVAPQGSDQNDGIKDSPFKTVERAQRAARKTDKSKPGKTVVHLRGGTYTLERTIEFDVRDSGTASHPVVYQAYPGEQPVLSGGRHLDGWEKVGKLLYQASTGGLDFRQLYVNGRKASRSRFPNPGSYLNLAEWNEQNQTILLPPGTVRDWQHFDEVEMYVQMQWSVALMRLETFSVKAQGVELTVKNPERDMVFRRRYPMKLPGQSFHFENAREFIDRPGEWSLSRREGICCYLPRAGEKMDSAEVIVPQLETLLSVKGTLDQPVEYLRFEGLTFMHSSWTMPSDRGYLNVQAGQYSLEPTDKDVQYVGRPPSAVYVACAGHLVFKRNVFKKLGSTGLDLHYGTHDCEVAGNVFYDIAGTAVSHTRLSDPDVEIHTPYNPVDQRDLCVNDWIHNNWIESVGYEYGGSVGILSGWPVAVKIEHNELRHLAYSGISVGWGWTAVPNAMHDNLIRWNHIDSPMELFSDGAGIYTLSEMPGSLIFRNVVSNVNASGWAVGAASPKCYYMDERSGGITFQQNCASAGSGVERYLFNQPGDIRILPMDASMVPDIIKNAGLDPEYRDIGKQAVD